MEFEDKLLELKRLNEQASSIRAEIAKELVNRGATAKIDYYKYEHCYDIEMPPELEPRFPSLADKMDIMRGWIGLVETIKHSGDDVYPELEVIHTSNMKCEYCKG